MNNRNKFFKKSSGKVFYITVAIALIAIAASVFAIRYTSNKLIEALPNETTNNFSMPKITTQAGNEVTSIPDTREEEPTTHESTAEAVTQETLETTTEITEKQTASAVAQITNSEYFLPLGGAETIKEFSALRPIENKTMGDWRVHNGVDFKANEGDDVHSVGNGVVTRVISDPKWGYIIEIDHGDFTARYCSLDQENAVGIGTELKAGDVIGKTAVIPIESADDPHLHFEAIKDGAYIDPLEALAKTDSE